MAPQLVAVFGASQVAPGDRAYDDSVEAGRLLAENGLAVATGGYGGVMEGAALGASAAGGATFGFTAPNVFPDRPGANAHIGTEVPAGSLAERIQRLMDRCSGFLVMPGSIGTLTELMVAWNSAFVTRYSGLPAKPVATVGEPWLSLMPDLAGKLATDATLVSCHDDVAPAVEFLVAKLPAADHS